MRKLFSLLILIGLLTTQRESLVFAEDIMVELSIDQELVEVGDIVTLGLTFADTQNIPAMQLPEIDGFKSQYLGPSTKMTIINGRMSSSITHRYRLVAIKTGVIEIGPFSFVHAGNTYISSKKQITVVDRGQAIKQRPSYRRSQRADASLDSLEDKIFLILSADKTKIYLNERVPITAKLYVNNLVVRDIQYPVFEAQGYIKEQFMQPKQYREQLGGQIYDVVEFNTYIYPTREGKISLGPARLKCSIVTRKRHTRRRSGLDDFFDDSFFADFFSRTRLHPMEILSAELPLTVLPFPEENKPEQFSGAAGDFQMQVKYAPLEVKAGDPITLTMEISGQGNFDSVQPPQLTSTKGFKVYNAEVQLTDQAKTFEQVIIPQSEDITFVPSIQFVFFDPAKEKYVTLTQPAAPIKVFPVEEKSIKIIDADKQSLAATSTKILGQDIVYIKEAIGQVKNKDEHFYNNKLFIGIQFLPLILLIGIFTYQKRRQRLADDISYARKLRAPKIARDKLKTARSYLAQNKTTKFYDQIFKTLQEYLGHRFNRPSAGITTEVIDELLAEEELDKEVGVKLKSCFNDCDVARYATAALDQQKMKKTLAILEEAIDCLETNKS